MWYWLVPPPHPNLSPPHRFLSMMHPGASFPPEGGKNPNTAGRLRRKQAVQGTVAAVFCVGGADGTEYIVM